MEKSILIVDDEAAVTLSLEGFFQHKGYRVHKAFYGDQALEQIQRYRPALVILDIQMPGLNGIGVLETIRKEYPEIKTLVITGYSDQYRNELDQLKANAVQTKPISLEELTRTVESLLEGQQPRPGSGKVATNSLKNLRVLFVEGDTRMYEVVLRPYFESTERTVRYETALACSPEELFSLLQEFAPQVIVMDSTRMPFGVDTGRLAADLAKVPGCPSEVILYEIPSSTHGGTEIPTDRLQRLEEAIQRGNSVAPK